MSGVLVCGSHVWYVCVRVCVCAYVCVSVFVRGLWRCVKDYNYRNTTIFMAVRNFFPSNTRFSSHASYSNIPSSAMFPLSSS